MIRKKMVVASRNNNKIAEMVEILDGLNWEVLSMSEAGVDFEVVEDGDSFEENSYKKALEVAKATGLTVIADDSGLEVDALGGRPGVYSARFSGEGATDQSNNRKLLELMEGIPKENRGARFVCAATVVFPDLKHFTLRGECEGCILFQPRGTGGFGYDPLFFVSQYNKTFAELDAAAKNSISHRARALSQVKARLAHIHGGME